MCPRNWILRLIIKTIFNPNGMFTKSHGPKKWWEIKSKIENLQVISIIESLNIRGIEVPSSASSHLWLLSKHVWARHSCPAPATVGPRLSRRSLLPPPSSWPPPLPPLLPRLPRPWAIPGAPSGRGVQPPLGLQLPLPVSPLLPRPRHGHSGLFTPNRLLRSVEVRGQETSHVK